MCRCSATPSTLGCRYQPVQTPVPSSGSRVHAQETPPRIVHHPADVVVKAGNPATLSCRADGSPKPTIEWLRNGRPLEKGDGQLQPIVLLEGSIFFLSVGGGKRGQSHEGVYTCVARSSAGKATSRNASLYIAGETGDPAR
ncbi:Roundabout 2 [Liparis tanakae]|uniref:Roundabout 2 n=1 Tax=Liparis tanakae TaxID=230148 RepID=A0A4Z2EBW4_9TELE|nr:Roundabout 2 [Liparis tanakae]